MSDALYSIKDNLANVAKVITEYEKHLNDVEENLRIKGKRLESANVEHASWLVFYDQKRVELYAIYKYMEMQVERVRGKLWKSYTEDYGHILSQKDKEQYINSEPAYLNMNELYLEIKELHGKYESIVDSYKARGFALNNITKIKISEASEYIL